MIHNTPDSHQDIILARRWSRLFASFLDCFILMIPFFLFAIPLLIATDGGLQSQPGFLSNVAASLYGFILFSLVNGYFLHVNGQTLGKKALGIKIVGEHYEPVPLKILLCARFLPMQLIYLIPIFGWFAVMINFLFIFKYDRRCLHDHMAGTQVIECPQAGP